MSKAETFELEVHAKRRECCCCTAALYLPLNSGGQRLATDDVIDRAIWTHGWGKWCGEYYCRECLMEKLHVRAAMVDDRAEGMAIRVVGQHDWRKR